MKYNMSNICKKANQFAKTMSLSAAFKKAWKFEKASVRIEEIEDRIFALNMSDAYSSIEDNLYINGLYNELAELRESITERSVIEQPTEQEREMLSELWATVSNDYSRDFEECDADCRRIDARWDGRIPASEVQDIINRYAA